MSSDYKFILDRFSRKFPCPTCDKRTWVRYVECQTGDFIPIKYGRCDREIKCGYFQPPDKEAYNNLTCDKFQISLGSRQNQKPSKKVYIKRNNIPFDVMKQTLHSDSYMQNSFIEYLRNHCEFPFKQSELEKVIGLYYLGTISTGLMSGAATFPFIDRNHNIQAIQIKKFDSNNHTVMTNFIHNILIHNYSVSSIPIPEWLDTYLKNPKFVSCLFGEHLLDRFPNNPLAIVEAPKTAIYGTLYFGFPENPCNLLWLSCYNVSGLTTERCAPLKGRKVYLFPDLSGDGKVFNLWTKKAKELSERIQGANFVVSDYLERNSSPEDKNSGLDIADFLIKMDWKRFRPSQLIGDDSKNNLPDLNLEANTLATIEIDPLEAFLESVKRADGEL